MAFADIRQQIIDGLISAQSEATGWNIEVRPYIAVTDVVRTSNTIVTITVPARANYAITATEEISILIAPVAVTSGGHLAAATKVKIRKKDTLAVRDSAHVLTSDKVLFGAVAIITGTILDAITETDIRTGGETIIISLTGDTWITN